MAVSYIKVSTVSDAVLKTISSPINITNDTTITLDVPVTSFSFIAFQLTSTSNNASGSRGFLLVPRCLLSVGSYVTCAVGNLEPLLVRPSMVSNTGGLLIRFISQGFPALYLTGVYGIR